MNFRVLTTAEATCLYNEARHHEQIILPSGAGAMQIMRHPLYGRLATLHDGDNTAAVLPYLPMDHAGLPGRPSGAMEAGATIAQLASAAVILMGGL